MEHISEHIRKRRSVRTFDSAVLDGSDKEKLLSFINAGIENPFGIPVKFKFLNATESGLVCPVVVGTELYVGGKVKRQPYASEAFGFSFETLVLYAQSLGIGTVWLGGTMNRSAFEAAMELSEDEMMPCASPLGYPAKKMSAREVMMRKAIKADERFDFEELFFNETTKTPLTREKAGILEHSLEMVRLSPSAVNKQPWRTVISGNSVHFYLKRSHGITHDSSLDMQRIDMGIALCHFELAAKESGLCVSFTHDDPGITGTEAEYIASYRIGK